MKIKLSLHAKQRMREYAVSVEQIKAIIQFGTKTKTGHKIIARWHNISCVYVPRRNINFIITVYLG